MLLNLELLAFIIIIMIIMIIIIIIIIITDDTYLYNVVYRLLNA